MQDHTITNAKAFAIILMVAGHAGAYQIPVLHNLQSFSLMPLFLFCSGYCFKDKYIAEPIAFIKRRFRSLWWPYVKWSLVFLAFHNLFFDWHIYAANYPCYDEFIHRYSINEFCYYGLKIISSMTCHDPLLGGYWFVHTLFYASLISFVVIKYTTNRGGVMVVTAILVALILIASYFNVRVPFFDIQSRELMASVFFLTGYLFQGCGYTIKWKYLFPILISLIVIAQFWSSSVIYFVWQDVIPYILCAIIGILAIINIARMVVKTENLLSRFLIFTGSHTFVILTWHFISFRIVSLMLIFCLGLPIEELATHPTIPLKGMWIAYTLVGVGVPLIGVMLWNKLERICQRRLKINL